MKPTLFLPPVLALLITLGWITKERHSISILERECSVLRKAIASRVIENPADSVSAERNLPSKITNGKKSVGWKEIAAKLLGDSGSSNFFNSRERTKLERYLLLLSQEELAAALEEIATLDLPDKSREALEYLLIERLVLKDPEFAIKHYFNRIHDVEGSVRGQLADAMGMWAKKDLASATAWFDQQIAAGAFDSKSLNGRSDARISFERKLLEIMISVDSTGALARLKSLPEDQRAGMMSDADVKKKINSP
ncbi:MAG: hypothetical protein HC845_08905 [Akkermansiaceae bacterium]|nr:hypothetical protein [Akkermansiaceae bacterium]